MVVRVLDVQIPALWENIKFCTTQADEVSLDDLPIYLNNLLCSLLSNKSQCFIRLDDDRVLIALMITRVELDKISGIKNLRIQNLYSFKHVSENQWKTEFEFIRNFARKEDCKSIVFDTRHEKIAQLGQFVGFREAYRSFKLELIGGI